jgi:ribonucleotide monophosphatase NagD (HAD superfamily)
MFDQDGVLWRGHDLIPSAVEALHAFRAAGKRLLFVTNNSSKSRQEYVAKFLSLGFEVAAEEVSQIGERCGSTWCM